MITPKVSWSCVCLNNCFNKTLAFTSLRVSIQIRIPLLSDSSRNSVIPSILFSFTKSAIFSIKRALFTMYGSSVTIILCFPFFIGSIFVTARTLILPLPVRYAWSIPLRPRIAAPVGKSGPFTISKSSSISVSLSSSTWLSMIFTTPSIVSLKLCGGILVAIPTAIPCAPFTRRFGNLDGRMLGSFSVSSKFGTKSTVSL